jgi:hypothetical protein
MKQRVEYHLTIVIHAGMRVQYGEYGADEFYNGCMRGR